MKKYFYLMLVAIIICSAGIFTSCSDNDDNPVLRGEWWEITINGDKMTWTALRKKADGTTFTSTFEMNKVTE